MVDIDQLWAVYQAGLSDYFPLHFVVPEGKSILVSPVVHHLLLKGLPIPRVDPFETNLAFSPFRETSKQAGKGEEGQERDEEKKEEKEDEKKSDVPFSHSAFFGKNARLGHLRSDLLVLGSPDALRAWKLPTENVDFIPRPYATNDLAKKLAAVYSADQDTRQVVLTTAVSGMGGVGKTELARHYVHHSKHNENEALNRDYQRRFWFDASSLSQLSISFRELGLALQLIEPKDDDI
jgi:hypothetical protein